MNDRIRKCRKSIRLYRRMRRQFWLKRDKANHFHVGLWLALEKGKLKIMKEKT